MARKTPPAAHRERARRASVSASDEERASGTAARAPEPDQAAGSKAAASAGVSRSGRYALLGRRSAAAFMRESWHKEAALIRQALPGFTGLFSRDNLFALAARDDVESRLVVRDDDDAWTFEQGPFRPSRFKLLPPRKWTLLVQGVNLVDAGADRLLRRFAFVPYARLDDLMVSYAAPGGGVGPHVDSYDVFLLQGFGRRTWRYGRQNDLRLVAGLPLKILRRFEPSEEQTLGPGDMLYLPPSYAHDGVAVDACTTYSIGFRAASHDELAKAFLDFLQGELQLLGRYADPDLPPTSRPARIDAKMQMGVARALSGIRWKREHVDRFLGRFLSEPKAHIVFDPPGVPLNARDFAIRAAGNGLALDLRTQLLYDARNFYLNGETIEAPAELRAALAELADHRSLSARRLATAPHALLRLLHGWYRDGFIEPPAR